MMLWMVSRNMEAWLVANEASLASPPANFLDSEEGDRKADANSTPSDNLQWPKIVGRRVLRCPKDDIQADSNNTQNWKSRD